ncbi:hypothetical protein RhiirA5_402222 [Rhizophagus irregularis]|uniref:Uncharacterized protein n=1 Tax=Rhizophagus irregularis TaxID=588596 RepID=A0A2N0P7L8_9GLOM|nr:hypothetical protein RhiirA5_402222 [Rhizophagus irregularis]
MAESYTCLRLDNRYVFQVEVYKKDNKIFFELGDKEIQFEKLKVGQLVEIISRKGKFEDSDRLNLWKVDVSKSRIGSTEDEIRELGGVSMEPECNFKKYFEADYGPTENNIHIIAVIQTTYTGHRTFAPSNRVHDDINYFIEPKEAVERLGNFLRDGKFCLLCGHRQSGKTTTAYAIEEWLLTNCDKDVYVMNLNNGIVINDGPEKFWWSICCQLESLDKNRFSFDKRLLEQRSRSFFISSDNRNFELDENEISEEIYLLTHGHKGLVGSCCSYIECKMVVGRREFSRDDWNLESYDLISCIRRKATYGSIVRALPNLSETQRNILGHVLLYRTHVKSKDDPDVRFLLAEGMVIVEQNLGQEEVLLACAAPILRNILTYGISTPEISLSVRVPDSKTIDPKWLLERTIEQLCHDFPLLNNGI